MSPRQLLPATLVWFSAPCLASDLPSFDAAHSLGRMLLGLGIVIALVFVLAWLARRASVVRFLGRDGNGPIALVGQLALGTRERLVLVEVDGQRILLAVVPGAVSRLDAHAAPTQGDSDFSGALVEAERAARQRGKA